MEFLTIAGAVLVANLLSSLILSTYVTIATRRQQGKQFEAYEAALAAQVEAESEGLSSRAERTTPYL
jgi:hypothetical protein